MKTTIITILGILMITGVLAYYPGETITEPNQMGIENLVYTIINNATEIPQLDVSINKENITITFPQDMPPTSFDIVFIEEQTKEVVQTIYRSSGGGTRYVDKNITKEVPVYVDRNITITETIELQPEKEIIEVETNNWARDITVFFLGMILLLIFIILHHAYMGGTEDI